jgi:hypothetical protein
MLKVNTQRQRQDTQSSILIDRRWQNKSSSIKKLHKGKERLINILNKSPLTSPNWIHLPNNWETSQKCLLVHLTQYWRQFKKLLKRLRRKTKSLTKQLQKDRREFKTCSMLKLSKLQMRLSNKH